MKKIYTELMPSIGIESLQTFLRKGGFDAVIGNPLRTLLSKKSIEEIIDFGDLPVFRTATTYPCILRVSNGKIKGRFKVVQVDTLDFSDLSQYVEGNGHLVNQKSLDDKGWALVDPENRLLLDKIMKSGMPLGEY